MEGGVKLALPQAGIWGTVSAYQLKRKNVPVPDPAQGFFAAIQTGEQRSRGFEADITWEPTRSLSILANYAYTDAKVTKDTVVPVGDRLARVPKHSGRIAVHYRVLTGALKKLSFGAGVTALSSRETWLPTVLAGGGINEWVNNNDVLARQVEAARKKSHYEGFALYRYDSVFRPESAVSAAAAKERANLEDIL